MTYNYLATEQPIDPYNHEGTLQLWQENKVRSSMYLTNICFND